MLRATLTLISDVACRKKVVGDAQNGIPEEQECGKRETKLFSRAIADAFRNEGEEQAGNRKTDDHCERAFFHDKSPVIDPFLKLA